MNDSKIFIVGSNGQLGTALKHKYPNAKYADRDALDITDKTSVENFNWDSIEILINAAAYTNVDGAETPEGRIASWGINADAVANLVAVTAQHNMTLIHVSSDYVFDGRLDSHAEDEAFSPLSVYGSSKAAGDLVVSLAPKYYLLRTSWVIGEGNNFVRTMSEIGKKGINPTVVSDQIGRLTFTSELVKAIDFLLDKKPPFGTYNVTNSGESVSWADITRKIYKFAGLDNSVTDISTEEYFDGKENIAARPKQSTLDLMKIQSLGFESEDWEVALKSYVNKGLNK